jgi:hypothetical protein
MKTKISLKNVALINPRQTTENHPKAQYGGLRLRHPQPCGLRVAGHPKTAGRRVSPEAPQERRETVATCGTSISSS